MKPAIVAFAAMASFLMIAAPAAADNAMVGKAMAERWCASCHIIAPSSVTRTTEGVPTFMAIARDPAKTDRRLRLFLTDPHPPMPNFHLSRLEMDDLVAYIQSLK